MSQTISNIRPRILFTINRKSTGSIDELRIICQGSLYMHCCRASPLLQLGFLVYKYCSGYTYVLLQMFTFCFYLFHYTISEIPWPIAVKQNFARWLVSGFYNAIPKIQEHSTEKIGSKNMPNLGWFLSNFRLWSWTSPERRKISKIGKTCDQERFFMRLVKNV